MNLHEITSGLRFPEGPIALADGSFLLVEIARGTLTRVEADGHQEVVAAPGGGPNGAAIGPDGKCYLCNNGGFEWHEDAQGLRPILQAKNYSGGRIERVDLASGAVEVLYTHAGDIALKGPNDIVFDAHGGFWFTDLGKVRVNDQDRGRVFYARADGSECREVIYPMVMPNGIGLSADGTRVYVAETEPGRLWEFEVTAPGEIRKQPWPSPHGGRLLAGPGGYQRFDSLAVDGGGNVCVATLINGGITVVSSDGAQVEHVPFPDLYTTNVCFGGPELRTAYVTLSLSGRLVAVEWPRAGLALHHLNR
jgi:gluconolactonase